MKKNLILALLLATCIQAAAQSKSGNYNSLLWKITGKGLSNPSYLFGTIHLTDKRVFNFSDSLYHFLETTNGYAAELDMEESIPQMMTAMGDDLGRAKLIVNLLPMNKLEKYKIKLEAKLKKPLNKITIQDLNDCNNAISANAIQSGEMNTIIDLYLYDIARRQGKWVGGIEDYTDQYKPANTNEEEVLDLINTAISDQTKAKEWLEWMIKIYTKQDLNALDLTIPLWKGAETSVLIKRNRKMALRMDSIMKIRTCFFAVGAAHLPGDSGVIANLRRNGFTVDPVYSKKTVLPADYVFTARDIPWVPVTIKENWYSIMMPGASREITAGDVPVQMQMYFDPARLNFYISFGSEISRGTSNNIDSLYRKIAVNMARKGKIISEKKVTINGNLGREFMLKSDLVEMRIQIFIPEKGMDYLILNMMGAYKADSLMGKDASHFFESFHKLKDAPVLAGTNWATTKFPDHAFSISFPSPFKEEKRDVKADTIWKTKQYVSTITNKNMDLSCGILVMEAKAGYYSDMDSGYFESTANRVLSELKTDSIEKSPETLEGFPAYNIKANMYINGEKLKFRVKMVNRGNRRFYFYMVYIANDSSRKVANTFFNSFQLLPIPDQKWQYQQAPTNDISLWAPSPIRYLDEKENGKHDGYLVMQDSISPASILIERINISPYAWWSTDSSFFEQEKRRFLAAGKDSLLGYRLYNKAGIKGAELEIAKKGTHNIKKVEILVNGDSIYNVFGFLPAEELANDQYKKLFESIKFTTEKPIDYHLLHKPQNIIRALGQGDSTAFANAGDALKNVPFNQADLPYLQMALLNPYRDFDPYSNSLHDAIIGKVLELDSGSTFGFIKAHYDNLKDSTEVLQYSFLSLLLRLRTKEAFDYFKEILQHKIPAKGNSYMLRYDLTDSLELLQSIFPAMVAVSADTNIAKLIPLVATTLLDSGLQKSMLEPYKQYYYAAIENFQQHWTKSFPDYLSISNGYIQFLQYFNEPESISLLNKFITNESLYIKESSAMALIKLGKQPDTAQMNRIAADDLYRVRLYEDLDAAKKIKYFPGKYNNQQAIAKSDLFNSIEEDYDSLSIRFVAERNALFQGKQQKFMLFKVSYLNSDGDVVSSLGIAGPYPLSGNVIITRSKITGLSGQEPYDINKNNQYLKDYLKQWETYLKEIKNKHEDK